MGNTSSTSDAAAGVLPRAMGVLRVLAAASGTPLRLTDIAERTAMAPATAHRLLQALIAEDLVMQGAEAKTYQLSMGLFCLAASAGGESSGLVTACRPALLRLAGMLSDTVFLLVRHNFDVVCIDRIDGVFPVRSHTGDIGGRVPLGLGQAGVLLLACLPEAEREAVIAYNVPRLSHLTIVDEITLRVEIARALEQDYVMNRAAGLFPGTVGLSVPVRDARGHVVAAFSIATPSERLNAERLPLVVQTLRREAQTVSALIGPFDPASRRPHQYLGTGNRA